MAFKHLVDTTILIDHLNGIEKATAWLSGLHYGEALISVVSRAEVLVRAGERAREIRRLLDEYDCLSIDADDADLAAELRGKWKIKLPDAFQAALAIRYSLSLVTRDRRDFSKVTDLVLKVPYSL